MVKRRAGVMYVCVCHFLLDRLVVVSSGHELIINALIIMMRGKVALNRKQPTKKVASHLSLTFLLPPFVVLL